MPLFRNADRLVIVTLASAILASLPAETRADDVAVSVVAGDSSGAAFELSLGAKAEERITGSLRDGVPVQVSYTVELWQDRPRWFDRLAGSARFIYLLQMDPWTEEYRLDSADLPGRSFPSQADLVAWLDEHGPFDVAARHPLRPEHEYYLAVHAAVAPLTEEQVGAVERWLRGESSDEPGMTGVLFDLVLRMSGLGVLEVESRSGKFRPGPPGVR